MPDAVESQIRTWCCRTPINGPHTNGCTYAATLDNPIDYNGTVRITAPDDDGSMIYLGDVLSNAQLQGVIGPPGPPGPPGGVLTHDPISNNWVLSISDEEIAVPGTSQTPALHIDIDGWRFSFASVEIARKVREKLMSMTLEGEL